MKNKMVRASNIELLRIIAMLMIVGSHLATHGVQRSLYSDAYVLWGTGSMANKLFTCFLNPGGAIGVSVFFLITGFFRINKQRFSISKIILQSAFYGLLCGGGGILAVFIGCQFTNITKVEFAKDALKLICIPATSGSWWFLTSYLCLLFFSPALNSFVRKLTRKGWQITLFVVWLFCYLLDGVLGGTWWFLERGILFYLIGGYLRQFVRALDLERHRVKLVVVFLVTWSIESLVHYHIGQTIRREQNTLQKLIAAMESGYIIGISTVVCAITLFLILLSVEIKSNKINIVAKTTFGIYLAHDSPFSRLVIWDNILKVGKHYQSGGSFPLFAIIAIGAIFTTGVCVDMVRLKWLEPVAMRVIAKSEKCIKIFVKDEIPIGEGPAELKVKEITEQEP